MINLLPLTTKKELRKLYRIRRLTVLFSVAAAFFLVMSALALPSYFKLVYLRPNDTSVTPVASKNSTNTPDILESVARANRSIETLLRSGMSGSDVPTTVLGYILDVRAKHSDAIYLKSFLFSPSEKDSTTQGKKTSTLELRGVARDRAGLRTFIDELEEISAVRRVDAPITNFLTDVKLPFVLTINFK